MNRKQCKRLYKASNSFDIVSSDPKIHHMYMVRQSLSKSKKTIVRDNKYKILKKYWKTLSCIEKRKFMVCLAI